MDRLCAELFLDSRVRQTESNLQFVSDRLLRSGADVNAVLDVYGKVRSGQRVPDDETDPLVTVLRLSGVVRSERGLLKLRNRIYAQAFDRAWIEQHTEQAELRRQKEAFRRGRNRAIALAGIVIAILSALTAFAFYKAEEARKAQADFLSALAAARHNLYIADMNLIQREWENNNVGHVLELLEETRKLPERGFEWGYWNRLCHLDLLTLKGHQGYVSSVAISPDGKRIVTGSRDNTARVWEAASGKELLTLKGHTSAVRSVAISPDGKRIVTGSRDNTARVWEAASGKELLTLKGHQDSVDSVAISPDGKRIVTGSYDRTARVWLSDYEAGTR